MTSTFWGGIQTPSPPPFPHFSSDAHSNLCLGFIWPGVVHNLHDYQGGGGTTPGLETGDLILSLCLGLAGIHILCASFWPVIHLAEENPGGVIILLSTEGLGAKWRKE